MSGAAVVWFKRDLRLDDHAALHGALATGAPLVLLYVFEPGLWSRPEASRRQLDFLTGAVRSLQEQVDARGAQLTLRTGRVLEVLDDLHRAIGIHSLHSHQETGIGWTYGRDRAVAAFCRARGIRWVQPGVDGVQRGHGGRDGWSARRERRLMQPALATPDALRTLAISSDPLPSPAALTSDPPVPLLPAGEPDAHDLLDSFLDVRSEGYERNVSSPITAWAGCSRLSPHLAFGTISPRVVVRRTERRRRALVLRGDMRRAESLAAYLSRLAWRDHFIQRLEDQPSMEFRCLHAPCESLRRDADPARLAAWLEGRTGYPMVDASMRALRATGWLNFRMRAMLVSFAAYDLWLPWRSFAPALGALFTDFEAGIHYSQIQMQSGTTGISALRIYDPTRQARQHDADGHFIRRWVPELRGVPLPALHTPWLLNAAERDHLGCSAYPAYPIVWHERAAPLAERRVAELRDTATARASAQDVLQRHGSRRGPRDRRWRSSKSSRGQSR